LLFHNLPAALDALDKPIGLPPSLLKKAEEIRLENGPERVEQSLEDVQMLASRAMAILTEVRAHIIVISPFLVSSSSPYCSLLISSIKKLQRTNNCAGVH
jgi:hypothetical protein